MTLLVLAPSQLEARGLAARLPAAFRPRPCGVGLVAAALGTARELASLRPGACLLLGIGGTRNPRLAPLGEVVLGTEVINQVVGAGTGADFLALGALGLPDEECDPDRLALALPAGDVGVLHRGPIGTVAAASADLAQAAAWARRHPDVLVEEMEGWAVALACRAAGVPLTILRAVSNVAGVRDKSAWVLGPALAALARSAERVVASLVP